MRLLATSVCLEVWDQLGLGSQDFPQRRLVGFVTPFGAARRAADQLEIPLAGTALQRERPAGLIVELLDDLDGSEATETVSFELDESAYEIDLNQANAERLRAARESFASAGRKTVVRAAGRRSTVTSAPSGDAPAIRVWAQAAGFELSDRGRIRVDIRDAYAARER